MNYLFRKAQSKDADRIWEILQEAIQKRKEEGSEQWQDGYPNPKVIASDLNKEQGFVIEVERQVAAYVSIAVNDEPSYDNIQGSWITQEDFIVFHRAAIGKNFIGKGLATILFESIEKYAVENSIYSIKADTNFDNGPMLHLFKKLGYVYCGEVYFRSSSRKAYEKVLHNIQ
ncbi:MAG: GNAT family N-acetyltransferase [Bacteroidota bacterium]